MNLRVTTGPTDEPVTLAEFKAHQRIDGTDEDDLCGSYIVTARTLCELQARRSFVTQTLQLRLEEWPSCAYIRLPRPPLQSVTSVTYVDSAGSTQTLSSGDYTVDGGGEPGRIWLAYGKSWPTETLRPGPAITITYIAGYGAAAYVPPIYKHAIQLTAGHFYENREEVTMLPGLTVTRLPMGVQALLDVDRGAF